jgi:ribose transport system substrate-binding protein
VGQQQAGDPSVIGQAKANLTKLMQPVSLSGGTTVNPPTGKTLGILNCGAAIPICNNMTAQAAAAATALGWKSFSVDGKLSPEGWSAGMEQLISRKPNYILSLIAQDSAMPQAMADAKKAGIPVVCAYCANTFVPPISTPSVANADNDPTAQGKAAADAVIAMSSGHAKVAVLTFNLSVSPRFRVSGFERELKKCPGCSVVTTEEIGATSDPAGTTRTKTAAILSSFPEGKLDWIMSPADTYTVGALQAIDLAHRTDVHVVGYDCYPDEVVTDLRAANTPDSACVDSPVLPIVWAAVDQIARIAANAPYEKLVLLPFQVVTHANAPAVGEPVFSFAYQNYYRKLWSR